MSVLSEHLDYSQSVGWSTRVRECDNCIGMGNSKAVQLTRKEDGFLWHCFRCSKSGFFKDQNAAPSQVKQIVDRMGNSKKPDNRPVIVTLPMYQDTFHPQGLVDLYDHYIEPGDIVRFNIGWNPEHQRIIFPLYRYMPGHPRDLQGWVGKKLSTDTSKDNPKWHTVRQRDFKHPRFVAPPEFGTKDKRVVLVEDPISAIRISQLGYHSIALLTTYLPYELYSPLRTWDVKIYLDDDALDKATKYFASLNSNGVKASLVHTKRDPKELSPDELTEVLNLNRG